MLDRATEDRLARENPNLMAARYATMSFIPGGQELASPEEREAFANAPIEAQRLQILGETAGWSVTPMAAKWAGEAIGAGLKKFPKLNEALRKPIEEMDWYRRLTIKEREIVQQSVSEMKDAGLTDGEILKNLRAAGRHDEFVRAKEDMIKARSTGENQRTDIKPEKPAAQEPIKPEQATSEPITSTQPEIPPEDFAALSEAASMDRALQSQGGPRVAPIRGQSPQAVVELAEEQQAQATPEPVQEQQLPKPTPLPEQATPPIQTTPTETPVQQPETAQDALKPEAKVDVATEQEVAQKEPWEMTRDEFGGATEYVVRAHSRGVQGLGGLTDTVFYTKNAAEANADGQSKNDDVGFVQINERPAQKEQHRRIVEIALSEGKPVPPEVLKDYPDLKSKGSAIRAAKARKLDAEPVEVEGGWGLRQAKIDAGIAGGTTLVEQPLETGGPNRVTLPQVETPVQMAQEPLRPETSAAAPVEDTDLAEALKYRQAEIKRARLLESKNREAGKEEIAQRYGLVADEYEQVDIDAFKKDFLANKEYYTESNIDPILRFKNKEVNRNEAPVEQEAAKKEPWEMTQDEWFNITEQRLGVGRDSTEYVGLSETRTPLSDKWTKAHREDIQRALSKGKPVPPEVLRDYPDLQKQASSEQPVSMPVENAKTSTIPDQKNTIYNIHVGGKNMFAVREKMDNPRGFGDPLFDTQDIAERYIKDRDLRDIANQEYQKRVDAIKKDEDRKEADRIREYEDIDGFADNTTKMARGRVLSVLNKKFMFNGKYMSRKEIIRQRVGKGWSIQQEGGQKVLMSDDGRYMGIGQITKTGVDYAEYLINKKGSSPTETPKVTLDAAPEVTLAKSGKPFKSKGMAALQAKRQGGGEVVEVEGGWGLKESGGREVDHDVVGTVKLSNGDNLEIAIKENTFDDDAPQLKYRSMVRPVHEDGSVGKWESAMSGAGINKDAALRMFVEKFPSRWNTNIEDIKFSNSKAREYAGKEIQKRNQKAEEQKAHDEQIRRQQESYRVAAERAANDERVIAEQMKSARAKKGKIRIKMKNGETQEVGANIIGDYAYRDGAESNSVTHIPSGGLMGNNVARDKKGARELAYRLSVANRAWDGKGDVPKHFEKSTVKVFREFKLREPISKIEDSEPQSAEQPTHSPGSAWNGRQFRPITAAREIKRGKQAGKFEVTWPDGKKSKVEAKDIRKMPGETPKTPSSASSNADTGGYADISVAMEMPEIVRLAKELLGGKYPSIKKKLSTASAQGLFRHSSVSGEIDLRADIFANPNEAAKTLAHEIGHLVDWLPDQDMSRGNILGRIASLKKFMKHTMADKPGGLGALTPKDRQRLRREAKRLLEADAEQWVDEEIEKTIPVVAQDILDIWNSAIDSSAFNQDLYRYVQGLSTAEKKSIIKEALKGQVASGLEKFAEIVKQKTGKKIKKNIPPTSEMIAKKYHDLINEEIKKRHLLHKDEITNELKNFTLQWKPFDPSENYKFTQYRFSSKELYADAISAVITNPVFLRGTAPRFYEAFFAYMENKPEVKRLYESIIDEMRGGTAERSRVKRLREGFRNTEAQYFKQAVDRRKDWFTKDEFGTTLIDRDYAVIRRVKTLEGKFDYTGDPLLPPHKNPRYKLEEMRYGAAEAEGYLTEFNKDIMVEAERNGLDHTDIGEYLFHRRVSTERSDVANPQGWTAELSKKRMAEMEQTLGPKVKEIADAFSRLRKDYFVDRVLNFDFYPQELKDAIASRINEYATFDVAKYLENRFGNVAAGKIYQQVGTLEDIGNPLTATVMKDIALMRATNKNVAAKSVADFMTEFFPDEITPADTRWNGKGHELIDPKDPNLGLLVYLKKGKMAGHYVPRHIAESFHKNPVEGQLIAQILRVTAQPFRTVFTELNPGFWTMNFARDFKRAARNLPGATMAKTAMAYTEGLKPAMRSVFGVPDPVMKEMQQGKMLISVADYRGDTETDHQLERLLKRYHVLPSVWQNKVLKPFGDMFYYVSTVSRGIERWPKAAAYIYLKKNFPSLSQEEIAHIVRVRAGSPAFLRMGTGAPIYNNLLIFSNAQKEGWRGDLEAAKASPSEFAWKAAKYNLIFKFIQKAILAGLLGSGLKEIYDRVSEYDMANYIIVPIGMTESGKAVYFRVPQDETGRLLGGVMWKLLNLDDTKSYSDLADYMAGQAPNVSPFWNLLYAVTEYAAGHNPYDNFRRRYAVDEQVFEAGGERSHKEFAKWLANNSGVGVVHVFKTERPGEVKTDIEKLLGYPIVSNIVGRFVKVSDYGLREKIRGDKEDIRRHRAQQSLDTEEAIGRVVNGDIITDEDIMNMAAKFETIPERIEEMIANGSNVYLQEIMSAQNQEERAAVIARALNDTAFTGAPKPQSDKDK
ncbi:hypothetical protein Dalk_4546 [Desulfatibacillum aliphaticivorans]|uniref:Large polyvalent protein associated domain-containing protein n=2 Tax=Desulfatibacillum aliphaticivorans TaxID=218208 RepID=B8FCR1_DESAL|nr:hypothetical protein Dalk_4546 [Desulfatibacillum aliphaticivorans]